MNMQDFLPLLIEIWPSSMLAMNENANTASVIHRWVIQRSGHPVLLHKFTLFPGIDKFGCIALLNRQSLWFCPEQSFKSPTIFLQLAVMDLRMSKSDEL